MTTFTLQDLTLQPQQENSMTPTELILDHINAPEVPRETKEALREILHTQHATTPQPSGENPHKPSQVNPEAVIEDMVAKFSISLRLLLTTVISQSKAQPEGAQESLQETVALVLQQSDWFKSMVHERAEELVDDKDFDYQIESAVETHFSNSFSLDDHVDITAEVESKVEDIAEDLLKDIVQEQLEEVVAEKLKNLRITFD